MEKQFLVTVSNDHEHLSGVKFICSFFKKMSEHQVTLLHINRLDSQDMNKALLTSWENPEKHLSIRGKRALDKACELLSQSRMAIEQMKTKTFSERYGKIKDILHEGAQGIYDAIILGKRASYTLQWFFEKPGDETAQAIIKDSSLVTPLWVCPEIETGRKHVLVCIDGSEHSFRAVDHVGYILRRQEQHNITLFNVSNAAGNKTEDLFQRSVALLHEHKISDDRIQTQTSWGFSVTGTILSKAEKGGYAAVAVGLRGTEGGLMKSMNLAGGTTSSLLGKIEKASLWCCP